MGEQRYRGTKVSGNKGIGEQSLRDVSNDVPKYIRKISMSLNALLPQLPDNHDHTHRHKMTITDTDTDFKEDWDQLVNTLFPRSQRITKKRNEEERVTPESMTFPTECVSVHRTPSRVPSRLAVTVLQL